MKKVLLLIMAVFSIVTTSYAVNDKPINPNNLPQVAKKFIRSNFNYATPIYAQRDGNSYEVMLSDNSSLEFNRKGEWTKVKCTEGIPEKIIPQNIRIYLTKRFEGISIIEIERERKNYKINLANGLELKFDNNGNLLEIDD